MSLPQQIPVEPATGDEGPEGASVGELIADRKALHMPASTTVLEAARFMSMMHMGAILVVEGEMLAGIFTERDVLNHVVATGRDPATTRIGDVMTRKPVSIGPSTTARAALALMLERNFRHLPVVDGEALAGIISLRDVVSAD